MKFFVKSILCWCALASAPYTSKCILKYLIYHLFNDTCGILILGPKWLSLVCVCAALTKLEKISKQQIHRVHNHTHTTTTMMMSVCSMTIHAETEYHPSATIQTIVIKFISGAWLSFRFSAFPVFSLFFVVLFFPFRSLDSFWSEIKMEQ